MHQHQQDEYALLQKQKEKLEKELRKLKGRLLLDRHAKQQDQIREVRDGKERKYAGVDALSIISFMSGHAKLITIQTLKDSHFYDTWRPHKCGKSL